MKTTSTGSHEVKVAKVGDARTRALSRLAAIEEELTQSLRSAHAAGVRPTRLAQLAGLSRPTIYDRLEGSESKKPRRPRKSRAKKPRKRAGVSAA
jgi:hypothetical protein